MKQDRVKDTVRKYDRVQSCVRKQGKVERSVRKHSRVKSSVRKCKIFIKPLKSIIYELSKNSDNQRCITWLESDRQKVMHSAILHPCQELHINFLCGTHGDTTHRHSTVLLYVIKECSQTRIFIRNILLGTQSILTIWQIWGTYLKII